MPRASAERCLAGALVLGGLGSMAPAFVQSMQGARAPEVPVPSTAAAARHAASWPSRASTASREQGASSSVLPAAAVLLMAAGLARSRKAGRKSSVAGRRAAVTEFEIGSEDPDTRAKNYVNPWEQEIELDPEQPQAGDGDRFKREFFHYGGPVYKKVPIIEGLSFPLDPALYYPPLEPPPPGAKWGDGRDGDGNWYLKDKDGKYLLDDDGNKKQFWQGTGRRKTAEAIVRIVKGTGQLIINSRPGEEYLNYKLLWWFKAMEPICALSMKNDFDVIAKTFGGGVSGQAGAMRLALARAMQEYDYNLRPLLRKGKYLTRDWRVVEAKKPGKPKARKSTPYHKR